MIYFDNAATSLVKPPEVAQAVLRAMSELGNVGRGVHAASLGASRRARRHDGRVAQLGAAAALPRAR